MTRPVPEDETELKTRLCPMHLLSPKTKSYEWKQRQAHGQTVHQQEAQEEHASKQAEKNMDLFHGRLQNRVDHALQMIANLWILGLFITPDFESSDL
jgi:hypothetical protein